MHYIILSRGYLHWLCQHELWCLHPGNYRNKQPTFESTSNAPPETGEGRKTLNCLPNETIWRHWMIEAGGLKVFGRGVAERKRDGGKKRCREKQQRSYIYETMSWVPLCRQDDNYRAQAKKPWLGKKREIFRLLGCRPWALKITTMLSSNPTV